jgi:formyltetrahydrofolate-dependent phosphoribosylglycinamide formyltransferase
VSARLVVFASGSGTNLQAVLDGCASGRIKADVVLVVVDRAAAPARRRARSAGVEETYRPIEPFRRLHPNDPVAARRSYDTSLATLVGRFSPDWIVLAGWMRLLTSAFLDEFPGRVVNLHPALPGQFPGAHAIDDAWAAHRSGGLQRTGVMVHVVPDERVDDGPVLASRVVPIEPGQTREALEARIHEVEHELLVTVLSHLSMSAAR